MYEVQGIVNEAKQYYEVLANYYEVQGDKANSLSIYAKLFELNPNDLDSRIRLSDLYLKEGDEEKAAQGYLQVAKAYKKAKRYGDAVRAYEKLLKLDRRNLDVQKELGECYLLDGQEKKALARLQNCFKHDPNNQLVLTLLARTFDELQMHDRAQEVRNQAVKLDGQQISQMTENPIDSPDRVEITEVGKAIEELPEEVVDPIPPPKPTHEPGPEETKLLGEIEILCRYGCKEQAIDVIQKALAENPHMPLLRSKLVELKDQ